MHAQTIHRNILFPDLPVSNSLNDKFHPFHYQQGQWILAALIRSLFSFDFGHWMGNIVLRPLAFQIRSLRWHVWKTRSLMCCASHLSMFFLLFFLDKIRLALWCLCLRCVRMTRFVWDNRTTYNRSVNSGQICPSCISFGWRAWDRHGVGILAVHIPIRRCGCDWRKSRMPKLDCRVRHSRYDPQFLQRGCVSSLLIAASHSSSDGYDALPFDLYLKVTSAAIRSPDSRISEYFSFLLMTTCLGAICARLSPTLAGQYIRMESQKRLDARRCMWFCHVFDGIFMHYHRPLFFLWRWRCECKIPGLEPNNYASKVCSFVIQIRPSSNSYPVEMLVILHSSL